MFGFIAYMAKRASSFFIPPRNTRGELFAAVASLNSGTACLHIQINNKQILDMDCTHRVNLIDIKDVDRKKIRVK